MPADFLSNRANIRQRMLGRRQPPRMTFALMCTLCPIYPNHTITQLQIILDTRQNLSYIYTGRRTKRESDRGCWAVDFTGQRAVAACQSARPHRRPGGPPGRQLTTCSDQHRPSYAYLRRRKNRRLQATARACWPPPRSTSPRPPRRCS